MIEQPERNDSLSESEPDTSGPSTGTIMLGALLILGGLAWLLDITGVVDLTLANVLPIALILVGLALVGTSRTGEHEGLLWLGVVLTLVLTVTSLANITLQSGIGDRDYHPTNVAELRDSYGHGIGNMRVDLRDVAFPAGETLIEISLGIGEMTVLLPDDIEVDADWTVIVGEAEVLDRTDNGVILEGNSQTSGFDAAERRLVLDLNHGIGSMRVEQ